MKHLIMLLGIPAYTILSMLIGKFVHYLFAPELTLIEKLSLLVIEDQMSGRAATSLAIFVTVVLILTGIVIMFDWWSKYDD